MSLHMLSAVFELVDAIEDDLGGVLTKTDYAKLRAGLLKIADAADPEGSFGNVDARAEPTSRR